MVMCQDWPDRPGCEGEADLEYTMTFDDIGEPPIYWCAHCGAFARKVETAMNDAYTEHGAEFLGSLAKAIEKAEGTRH